MTETTPQLTAAEVAILRQDPEKARRWFVEALDGKDWMRAAEVLQLLNLPDSRNNKRWLCHLVADSSGKICGHGGPKGGYKLVRLLTEEEYTTWRRDTLLGIESLQNRISESDIEWGWTGEK